MRAQLPTVRDFMDRHHHAFHVDEPVLYAVGKLIDEGVTGAPVIDDQGKLVGMLTESECLHLVTTGTAEGLPPDGVVGDFMERDAATVRPEMNVYHVAGLFIRTGKRRFAVEDDGELVGVITRKDVLRVLRVRLEESET